MNKEETKRYMRKYRKNHPEKSKEYDRKYRENNKERIKAMQRKYYLEHGETMRATSRRHRLKHKKQIQKTQKKPILPEPILPDNHKTSQEEHEVYWSKRLRTFTKIEFRVLLPDETVANPWIGKEEEKGET